MYSTKYIKYVQTYSKTSLCMELLLMYKEQKIINFLDEEFVSYSFSLKISFIFLFFCVCVFNSHRDNVPCDWYLICLVTFLYVCININYLFSVLLFSRATIKLAETPTSFSIFVVFIVVVFFTFVSFCTYL